MPKGVIDIDRGWRALFRRAFEDEEVVVTVGVQGTKAAEDHAGISNVRLAGVHEFGAQIDTGKGIVSIPERSFIRATVEQKAHYKELVRQLGDAVLSKKIPSVRIALGLLGEKVASDIKSRIEAGIPPPNAPSTVEAKGSSTPLIDTAQLKNSITWELREKPPK